MSKASAPPAALYAKGIPKRIHMPAEMAADIAQLLENSQSGRFSMRDSHHAEDLAATLRRLLSPRCGYGYRFKRSDGCPAPVIAAGDHCEEHTPWPALDGTDPDPARCPGTPLHEDGTATWVPEGAWLRQFGTDVLANDSGTLNAMRCPYPRRPDGSPCALHDPRPEDQCGRTDSIDAEPCLEVTALYGCPKHHAEKVGEEVTQIRRSVLCTHCGAKKGQPCTGRPEAYNDYVHAPRKKKTQALALEYRRGQPTSPPSMSRWQYAGVLTPRWED